MREELKRLDYHVYGLKPTDFDYFLDIVRRVGEAHLAKTRDSLAHLKDDPDAVEFVADTGYYAWIDTQYLWEYALWRLQGILEGIISTQLLFPKHTKERGFPGLQSRLRALQKAGYTLSTADRDDLLGWAKLRNALSHRPPEPYRPLRLTEHDLVEYRDLVVRLCNAWLREREQRSHEA